MTLFAALHRAIDAQQGRPAPLPAHPDGVDESKAEAIANAIFHDGERCADYETGYGPELPAAVVVLLDRKIAARNAVEDRLSR